tara:strand:- start:8772 stop:9278 length:507 start_codon:yes stop_codon:yes gene_type:complete
MAVKIYGSNQIDFDANNIIQNTQLNNTVLNDSLTALDTTASNGATSNADNDTLPLFGCRAFVNFNGTSYVSISGENHCAIRSSGNVSKVVRTGTGDYNIFFTTAMPDGNYVITSMGRHYNGVSDHGVFSVVQTSDGVTGISSSSVRITTLQTSTQLQDSPIVMIAIFR